MEIETVFVELLEDSPYEQSIWELLCESDQDFHPPLSSRNHPSQQDVLCSESDKPAQQQVPTTYFQKLKKQFFLIAIEKDTQSVVGFLSFIHNYQSEVLDVYQPSNYATTTCVSKLYRNQGIGKQLMRAFENDIPLAYQLPFITRRTWSTNRNQIHLINKLGYEVVKVLRNHRGKGVHTLFFAKSVVKK